MPSARPRIPVIYYADQLSIQSTCEQIRNKLNLAWFEPSFNVVLQKKKSPSRGPRGTFFYRHGNEGWFLRCTPQSQWKLACAAFNFLFRSEYILQQHIFSSAAFRPVGFCLHCVLSWGILYELRFVLWHFVCIALCPGEFCLNCVGAFFPAAFCQKQAFLCPRQASQ